MKRALFIVAILAVLAGGLFLALRFTHGDWHGTDDRIKDLAERSGRPAWAPLIDIEKYGDLPLFMFMLAGAVGGFVAGYVFRGLFPPRKKAGANRDQG